MYLLIKLLLPGVSKRVYNLQSKQIVKLLSQVFQCSVDNMIEDLDHVSNMLVQQLAHVDHARVMLLKLLKSFFSRAQLVHHVRIVV